MPKMLNSLAKSVILLLQNHISRLGYTPVIHFEWEGCYRSHNGSKAVNFSQINQRLQQMDIGGKLIPEYWAHQWEYVSLFNGQSPLMEAEYLTQAMTCLPKLFAEQGIEQTLIKPVVWAGDKGKLAQGCENIFSDDGRAVHIPNAIQMNISVNNALGKNIVTDGGFGEYLQYCFLRSSLACSLLYLPEEEAFERFALKSKYGLADELCSPSDISGGHQGSVALYKKYGKHNQSMGETPLVYDHLHQVIVSEHLWQQTARIEHRLGASSVFYNPYINVIYALVNIIDALQAYKETSCQALTPEVFEPIALPLSLYCQQDAPGAITLFAQDNWFADAIDKVEQSEMQSSDNSQQPGSMVGTRLKSAILDRYQRPKIII
ncbi:hypothetical protein tinsulaeT_25890 [Thalassotalea insulae]|uniref:Uncharacterized protein n=1 Tax=Thalassotalea insulae TaxID=2056778 RepID=A0ABQ6GV76_9GAMM|nr:hypothetical protein [Thalassotalea insulae]GLX79249.1 hypothetical protein tinsulaeT_25890 [Thalassotalea insulae]